jgi:hypothetical protein
VPQPTAPPAACPHITYMIVNFIFNHHHLGLEDFHPSIINDLEAAFLLGEILLVLFGENAICGSARPVKIATMQFIAYLSMVRDY